jgi:ABC-type uncharacterized transport system substrate-binding protein
MRALLILLATLAAVSPAIAHPHVWVTIRAELLYRPDGRIEAIRHAWTFDESYSAFATQGLADAAGKIDPVQARELAQTNIESLAENGYFTNLRAGGTKQGFDSPRDAEIGLDGKLLTLRFTLPVKAPPEANRLLLDVYDPTFFVDFSVAEGDDAVRLKDAPAGCSVSVQRPKPEAKTGQNDMSEALFQALTSAGSNAGSSFANRTLVSCR